MTSRRERKTKQTSSENRRLVSPSHYAWRLFCATELPDQVRAHLRDHVGRLRSEIPDVTASWSRPENVHLTLKFFGNVDQDRIPSVTAAIARSVRTQFRVTVGESGVFPKPSQARVLWIGITDPSGNLADLQRRVEDECAAEGFAKEDRAFRPHLTIAWLRRPEGARQLAEAHLRMGFEPIEVVVNELVLFRSELSSKGSIYTAITRHAL